MTKKVISRYVVTHTAPLSISRHAETLDPDSDRSQETLQVHSNHPSQKEVKNKSCLLNTSQHERNTHSICHFPGRELQDRSAATESCFPSLSIHLVPFQPLFDHSCTFLRMAKVSRSWSFPPFLPPQEPPGLSSLSQSPKCLNTFLPITDPFPLPPGPNSSHSCPWSSLLSIQNAPLTSRQLNELMPGYLKY